MLATRKGGAQLSPQAEKFVWYCRDYFDLHGRVDG